MAIRSSSDEKKAMTSVSMSNQTETGTGPEPPASKTSARVAYFRYFGGRTFTVLGPVSGQMYHFVGHGSVVAVDARDRRSLIGKPGLRELAA